MENSKSTLENIQKLLIVTYAATALLAGADKLLGLHLLAQWAHYLPAFLTENLPFSASLFLRIVGIIEILAGVLVFLTPEKGFYLVSAWLVAIAINLLLTGQYVDIAVRDLVLAVSAFAAAKTVSTLPKLFYHELSR